MNEDNHIGETSADRETLRQLDAEVAERVMGFRWFHCEAGTGVKRNQFCSKEQEETWRGVGWKMTEIPSPPPPDQFNDDSGTPRYSSRIADAMQVVEKMRGQKWDIQITSDDETPAWHVSFDARNEHSKLLLGEAESDSLPEAICRAALKATECLSDSDHGTNGQASKS